MKVMIYINIFDVLDWMKKWKIPSTKNWSKLHIPKIDGHIHTHTHTPSPPHANKQILIHLYFIHFVNFIFFFSLAHDYLQVVCVFSNVFDIELHVALYRCKKNKHRMYVLANVRVTSYVVFRQNIFTVTENFLIALTLCIYQNVGDQLSSQQYQQPVYVCVWLLVYAIWEFVVMLFNLFS